MGIRLNQTATGDGVSELGDLIGRMADDVARDETILREMIINLIDDGKTVNAVELLRSWNATAAGDLLKTLDEESSG